LKFRAVRRREAWYHIYPKGWRFCEACWWKVESPDCFHEVGTLAVLFYHCPNSIHCLFFICVLQLIHLMLAGVHWRSRVVWVLRRNSLLTSSPSVLSCELLLGDYTTGWKLSINVCYCWWIHKLLVFFI